MRTTGKAPKTARGASAKRATSFSGSMKTAKGPAKKAATRTAAPEKAATRGSTAKQAAAPRSGASKALTDLRREIRSLAEGADRLLERLG